MLVQEGSNLPMSLVSSSVNVLPPVAMFNMSASHKKNETSSDAISIGNLNQESDIVKVSDEGNTTAPSVSTTFTANAGTTSLTEVYGNIVDQASTTFQLLDKTGAVIASNSTMATDAQLQAFSKWRQGTLAISAGNYTATASAGNQRNLSISKSEQQGTMLQVNSTLTGSDASEYYKFSLSGSNIKLDFHATTHSNSARIVLYNSAGAVVADSGGDLFQKANYTALTSGTGLSAKSGDYTAKVTYANNADTTKDLKYTMNLYSGNSYAVEYKSNVKAQPYDDTAAGSVTAASNAQLYQMNAYNKISSTASNPVNIGWMKQDQSMLDVYSQLTNADNTDYYSFTLEQGNNLKFGFNAKTTPDTSGIRVQLMNRTGTAVIADNEGTAAQQEAYKELTTTNGLQANTGKYIVKISYTDKATKKDTPYEFGIYSGSVYTAQYKTIASAQTFANAALEAAIGNSAPPTPVTLGAYLSAAATGDDTTSLTNALQCFA
jgi:hypothetical protein